LRENLRIMAEEVKSKHEERLPVLLISPPLYRLFGKMQATPPAGLLYLSRYLNVNGIRARVYNSDFEGSFNFREEKLTNLHEQYLSNLKNVKHEAWEAIRKILREYKPKIVGITVVTSAFESAVNTARMVKEELPDAMVVFGGSHVTALPEESAKLAYVDAVIIGEGEITLYEIAQGMEFSKIDGICYKKDGKTVRTKQRELIPDINVLPFPMLEDLIFEKSKKFSFNELESSRGCPYSCIFCASETVWHRRLRLRTPENICKEIQFRRKRYGTNEINFWDEAFTLQKERAIEICKFLKKMNIDWSCQTRADHVTPELLKIMADSGCKNIGIGIESGSQRILDIAKKNLKIEDIKRAAKMIKASGIEFVTFFIFGLPGETEESIEETFKLIDEIEPDIIVANIATPLPGTEFFDMAMAGGWITDTNWSNYYFLGRLDSVVTVPTIPKEKVIAAYLRLQKVADSLRQKTIRRKFLNPRYIVRHISLKEIMHPEVLWRKIKAALIVLKG
jgi:anaerobic magnesium-protoporphyrin IX monomethyl ester cyclase